jgi:two-component system sensor histidine kinase BaeS
MLQTLRIRTKLLLAIGGLNILSAVLVYILNNLSFDRGFSNYLGQQMLEQQDELVQGLTQEYRRHGSWQWLKDNPADMQRLFFNYSKHRHARDDMPPPEPPPGTTLESPAEPPPPPGHERTWFGLMVLDAGQIPLSGFPRMPRETIVRPLVLDGVTIGYLGYAPRRELSRTVNQAFQSQQQQMFGLIALAMLASSVLMAWGISQWLNRRLQPLTEGAQQLTKGDFSHRIAVDSADELALLARDFNVLAQSLAASQQSRQRWIIDISHELRTPLAILQGELEALRDGVRPLSAAHIHSLWQEIQRLSHLVNDLHLLSQADAGSLSYHRQMLDLADSIADALQPLRPQFAQQGITINLQLLDDIAIRGDHNRLRQLWLNLAQNTLRYTDAPGQLHIGMSVSPHAVVLTWQDSSPGVSDSDLPRLTERLFRVDSSRNRASGGSGLGLSIVKAIADAHRIELAASASALGGVCWTLYFPLAAPAGSKS